MECVGCGKFTNWQIFTITQHCLISKEVVSLLRSTLAALAVNSYLHWPNDNIWLTHRIKAGLAGCQQLSCIEATTKPIARKKLCIVMKTLFQLSVLLVGLVSESITENIVARDYVIFVPRSTAPMPYLE